MPGSNVVAFKKMTFEMVNSACGISVEHRVVSSCPTFPRNFQLPLIMEQLSWLPGRQVALAGWLLPLHSPTEQGHPAEWGGLGENGLERRETSNL